MRTVYIGAASSPAVDAPVTLNEVKDQLRILHGDQDALLTRLLYTAVETVEDMARRRLLRSEYDGYLDSFPCSREIDMPLGQLASVASITYTDSDDVAHVFAAESYYVDTVSEPGRIVLNDDYEWPSDELRAANGVVIRFTAGFLSAATVPEKYKQAIHLLVGHWYKNPEAALVGSVTTLTAEIEFGVRSLIGLSSPMWI